MTTTTWNGGHMKAYETPELFELGTVADFTRGEGLDGDADSFWIFRWGS